MKVEGLEDVRSPPNLSSTTSASLKVYMFMARALEAAVLLLFCPYPSLPVVASTSHPRPSHYKVHAGPCGALGHGVGGGVGGGAPRVVPADVVKVKMSDSHWEPCEDAGEGAEGARGGQS